MRLNLIRTSSFAILTLLVMGCSASWHLNRAKFKDPSLFVNDTIRDTVTLIYNPPPVIDSTVIHDGDTVTIRDSVVFLRFIRTVDTLWYEVDCLSDTITKVREIPYPVIKEVYKETNFNPWLFVAGALTTVILLIFGFNISRR